MIIKTVVDTNIVVSGLGNPSGAPAKLLVRWLDGQFVLLFSSSGDSGDVTAER